MPKKLTDGTEHCAHVLFTELVTCKREGAVFYAGGRSKDYERCGAMTEEYARALVAGLTKQLAELDAERGLRAPAIDDLELGDADGQIAFRLKINGEYVADGVVTEKAALKARSWLDKHFDPPNVARLRKRGTDALVWLLALAPSLAAWGHACARSALA